MSWSIDFIQYRCPEGLHTFRHDDADSAFEYEGGDCPSCEIDPRSNVVKEAKGQ